MKKIKFPSITILILASLGAFWLAGIVNPSFNLIGIGILLLIPIFMIDFLYPRSDLEKILEQLNQANTVVAIEDSNGVEAQ